MNNNYDCHGAVTRIMTYAVEITVKKADVCLYHGRIHFYHSQLAIATCSYCKEGLNIDEMMTFICFSCMQVRPIA